MKASVAKLPARPVDPGRAALALEARSTVLNFVMGQPTEALRAFAARQVVSAGSDALVVTHGRASAASALQKAAGDIQQLPEAVPLVRGGRGRG